MRTRKNFNPKVSSWAKEVLCGLNEIKNGLVSSNRPFTLETLCKSLKELGLPVNATFKTAIVNCELPIQKCKLLTQVSKGSYVFTKPKEPIHWVDLQAIYTYYCNLCEKYRKSVKEAATDEASIKDAEETLEDVINEAQKNTKKKDAEAFEELLKELREMPKSEPKQEPEEESDIQKAINLLKSHGYQIFAPAAVVYKLV